MVEQTETVELVELEPVLDETKQLVVTASEKTQMIAVLREAKEALPALQDYARALVITDQAGYEQAAAQRKLAKGFSASVTDTLAKQCSLADSVHKRWTGLRGLLNGPLGEVARVIGDKQAAFITEEERRARETQERLRREAEEAARQERAKLERQAQRAETKGHTERADELREQADNVVPLTPVVAPAVPKIAGQAVRKTWEIMAVEADEFIVAAAAKPELRGFLKIDFAALKKARNANPLFAPPGVTFEQRTTVASGK